MVWLSAAKLFWLDTKKDAKNGFFKVKIS